MCKKILLLPGIEEIMLQAEEILLEFQSNKEKRNRLKYQQINHETKCLQLIKACDTRWSSHLASYERLFQLKNHIDFISFQTPSFWFKLKCLIEFLNPFKQATDLVQSDA